MKIAPAKSIFNKFTKQYKLSKTLRFELRPVSETKPFLKSFVEIDTQRADDYQKLKNIIDNFHRDWIEKTLSQKSILKIDFLRQFKGIF